MNERYRNEAAETAQRLAAEEILTVLAHDLRNYLTPLTGRIELLERRAHREKDESYERQLDTLSQGMKRLQNLTANLLDAERLRQGLFSLDYQPVDLAEIVEEVLPIWSLPDHPIQIQVIDPLAVLADRDRIQQAIENLLSNAVTHAEPKTPIHIVLKEERRENSSWAMLTVRNQSVTLSPEQFQNLFQPFVKGVRSPGLGLGLWLAQRIAQSHHGTLTARMEAENTFCLTLALPLQAQ